MGIIKNNVYAFFLFVRIISFFLCLRRGFLLRLGGERESYFRRRILWRDFSFFKFDGERRDFLKLTIFHDHSRRDSNYLSQKIYIYICMYNREE